MDLSYDDREAGHLLGVWFVALGLLALSTVRPGYSPVFHPVFDRVVFGSLVVGVGVGAIVSRYRDLALGVPMAVCGGLVVVIVIQSLLFGSVDGAARTLLAAVGLCSVGVLFVREGFVIARGRRHRARQPQPSTRWRWWLGAAVMVAVGVGGL